MSGIYPKPAGEGSERRREKRIGFTRKCHLAVVAPPWALTREPLGGITENITKHGLKVVSLRIEKSLADSWRRAARSDEELRAEVVLPEIPGFPKLRGQIVWVHYGDGECSIGVLFSILTAQETKTLNDLVDELDRLESPV